LIKRIERNRESKVNRRDNRKIDEKRDIDKYREKKKFDRWRNSKTDGQRERAFVFLTR
jgi:hypothetical protein